MTRSVAFVATGPQFGSIHQYAARFASALSNVYSTSVLTHGVREDVRPDTALVKSGYNQTEHGHGFSRFLRMHQEYRQLVRDALNRFDIVHLCSQRLAFLAKDPSRIILTVHDIFPFGFERGMQDLWRAYNRDPFARMRHLYFRKGLRQAAKRGIITLADSRFTKRNLECEIGYPSSLVHVIPFPLEKVLGGGIPDRAAARSALSIPISSKVLLSISSDEPRKNMPTLYRVLNRLEDDVQVIRVGPIDWSKLEPRRRLKVRLYQDVPNETLHILYAASDLLLLPSRAEGFGAPLAEAMSYGVPIVGSNAETIREVTANLALSCDPMDVEGMISNIHRVFHDPRFASAIAKRERDHAVSYHVDSIAQQLVKIYDGLCPLRGKEVKN